MTEIHRLARRLREQPHLSRNRHFDELSQPIAQRARRILRRLAGIERELRAAGAVEVRAQEGGYLVTIHFPALRARRVAYLTAEEHALLTVDAALRPLFAALASETSAEG